jgi:murein DD-endopeptidase MepM/ murein hydrolase activator NlpD
MKIRWLTILLMAALLTSCTGAGSLWGTYGTPTSEIPPVVLTLRAATATPEPTLTFDPPTPVPTDTPTATATPVTGTEQPPYLYYAQAGDSLPALAARFGVDPSEVTSAGPLPATGLINPGTLLVIPNRMGLTSPSTQIMPDSEVVYSPSATDFDTAKYVSGVDGYLKTYKEYLVSTGWTSGANAVQRIAIENSINPRLLLTLVQFESKWVLGQPTNLSQTDYPLGYPNYYYRGLFRQMMWAVQELMLGYYGWREGSLTELTFPDGSTLRLAPDLNAGSVAVMYFFAQRYNQAEWAQIVDPRVGFPALHAQMFGDPWARAQTIEPLFPADLVQPPLVLPFAPGQLWSFTGGPHPAWEHEGALAALDFAPAADTQGCLPSDNWIVASASGLVVRSGAGVVMVDLDGDGHEQTGWDLLYLHVADTGRVPLGTWVNVDDKIGHPSCEGGVATGTHLHFARKFNGEWILAGGALPFELSGWTAHNGDKAYHGTLTHGDEVVTASQVGSFESRITRDK